MKKIKPTKDTRTFDEFIRDAAEEAGAVRRLEFDCGLTYGVLKTILAHPERRPSEATAVLILKYTGCPVAAQIRRHERICDVMADELRGA